MLKPAAFPLLLLLLPCWLPAQLSLQQQAAVDAVFAEFTKADTGRSGVMGRPGCALAIVKDGEIAYSQGYGMADLEHGIPITPHSVFYAGSVSKQFVATCILLLQEEGRIDIDDDVRTYVPELPFYGETITLRHLLHHTSGLRDYLDLWTLSGRDYLDHLPKEAVLEMICRQQALNFAPGEKYAYSNSGYFLLMTLIERVSGQSLKEFARVNIFQPLGMDHSHFHDDRHHLVPDRAWGYRIGKDKQVENLIMRFDLVGSGGLYTTVGDLYRWDQNFYENKLGKKSQSLTDTLQQDGRLNSGLSAGYAFALINGDYRGLKTVGHTGSMGGYRAYYLRFPEHRFSIILLGNFAGFTPVGYAQQIADLLLEPLFSQKRKEAAVTETGTPRLRKPPSGTERIQAPGSYYSAELDAEARISGRGDDLDLRIGYGPTLSLPEWISRGQGNGMDFLTDENGRIYAFLLHAGDIKGIRFEKR